MNASTAQSEQVEVLSYLGQMMAERKAADPDSSYVAKLYHKGLNKILEKVGEEAIETVIAAKDFKSEANEDHKNDLIYEVADLWFHTIVILKWFSMNWHVVKGFLVCLKKPTAATKFIACVEYHQTERDL
ncbi:unnamed protein product [Notodromas monacha]|uniref:phosphoribosyl-ATP diphosphatase n=1 Tax=Notodromas monacha TaxID=399045 RepID=A0A7R9GL70_9CRUS|nr:unnamed protein product [Notodromas monacha]CAG0925588.1 unnamed protein product [Notodromas monacha]